MLSFINLYLLFIVNSNFLFIKVYLIMNRVFNNIFIKGIFNKNIYKLLFVIFFHKHYMQFL